MGTHVVTGSASGIGAATRRLLEAAGHEVIGVDLRDAEVTGDLSDPATRSSAVDTVLERCNGKLDGLVTAAGVGPPFDPSKMLAVNYFGSAAFLSGLRPALAASAAIAKVVAISSNSTTIVPDIPADLVDACLAGDESGACSLLGDDAAAMNFAYAGGKTAIARFVRRNAPTPEWAGAGIRLNAIAPGAVLTPLLESGLASQDFGPLIKDFPIPVGGFGQPDQIATWILHMLSPEADFMCGSLVFVDGGSDALVRPDAWPASYSF
jgi:NAD(P)-dependent dehydrogenase (short-subunit alcohol dehydrogenase family)